MNLKFKHKNPDLARARSTIITEECLGKYVAFAFDHKTKEQVDVKPKVGESQMQDYFYVNTEQKDEDLVGKPEGMRQLLFERGCLESPSRPEAAKLIGNMPDYLPEKNKFTIELFCPRSRIQNSPETA